MTAQMSDYYNYKGKKFDCLAVDGNGLFSPKDYGLHPKGIVTSCWRGYWCEYRIDHKQLRLDTLHVFDGEGIYPDICGVKVSSVKSDEGFGFRSYKNLNLPIMFTGKVLLAYGFIPRYYIHMGFQKPYAYRKSIELKLNEGNLIQTTQYGRLMGSVRKELDKKDDQDFLDIEDTRRIIKRNALRMGIDELWWV